MILAIDTATQYASLALYNQDGVLAEESWFADRNHTVEVMPRLTRMLKLANLKVADLTALAVSLGPGSFTGVRIGLAVAKGLALPYKLPVIGVSTLEIAAYPLRSSTLPVWAIVQAGRGRIIAACYGQSEQEWQLLVEPHLTTFENLAHQINKPALCTGEIDAQAAHLLQRGSDQKAALDSPAARLRRASYLAEIAAQRLEAGDQDDPDALTPIYVSSP
ncbi:MAG: tRNA (adenosine(37)-N6)-threonylcarbamoyltransferase complex dimerization subunit type 1 TsaB [Anaerolineales bacterium]|nr:tRNA (adenosine(37)-N6)-threonylcarbamoyltransferase complex dimerization subunit type 1 TsaB [Anaerolineales bacterium]